MGFNILEGGIPTSLSNCSRLLELNFDTNHLTGGVPSELGLLTELVYLYLEKNNLKGKLPAFLGNLTSLMELSLGLNNMEGIIPDHIGRLTQIEKLGLAGNNFSGVFPPSIYNCSSLILLYISGNDFSGSLRPDFGTLLPNLLELNMGKNYFTGVIPTTLPNISTLQIVDLDENNLTGSIPPAFGKLLDLQVLLLFSNSLGSNSFGDLEFMAALANCTKLERLEISWNRLVGDLPTSIVNLSTNLNDLNLGRNFISGSIPHDIGNLKSLRTLAFDENMLIGVIPTSLSKLSILEGLFLSENKMSGEIPSFIGNLTRLDKLYLFNNKFQGTIPLSLSNFLTGSLPEDVGQLEYVVVLSVANNKLSGQLPHALGNCLSMEELNLRGNFFDGVIPAIRELKGTKRVDFSHNNLSGIIPTYLAFFSSLEYLNLSINNFDGSVPTEGIFQNATVVSVIGNKNLCGGIKEFKQKPCFRGAPPMGSKHPSHLKKVAIGVSIGMALLLLLFVASASLRWFIKRKKNQQTNNPTPSTLDVFHEKISYGEIRNATDGFSSSNMIGSGSFGTVFKALLPAENVVAVKVLNMQRRGAMRSFLAECESLKDIRHRNLVKLITACSSTDFQGNKFRALIYEFMPNGSLDMWLHPEEVEEVRRPSRTLTLLERLNIAINVPSVLDYLHVHCHEPIAHCDIKPSNVLLDDDLTAHVSDIGLARLLLKFDQESFLNQLSSTGVRGTIGYAAPEYGMGGQPSIGGDVYSFGVLVLELFTGKRPTNELFGGNFTLYSYTKSELPERVIDIADESINIHSGLRVGFPIAECLRMVLEVGLRCGEESPANRLAMSGAAKELISIRERFFKTRRTTRR